MEKLINNKKKFIKAIKNNLIVSCQAVGDEPLNDAHAISLMAKACVMGGAKFLRVSQKNHIESIKKLVSVPMIGIIKKEYKNSEIYITPTINEIKTLANLGVDCIAMDATLRKRPKEDLKFIVSYTKKNFPNICLMADCASLEEVINAEYLKFDLIGTTLRGYTKETQNLSNIDNNFQFIKIVLKSIKTPLIVEGKIWTPAQVKAALKLGAHAVVVGSAITRPLEITKYFISEINKK